jgi:two-component system, OmpR family, KDP operon response regulator KdpE
MSRINYLWNGNELVQALSRVSKPLILVIEDDLPMRRYLKLFLSGKGYAYSEADNGEDGVILARKQKPDLILLDLGLPDIDGVEVTKRIRHSSQIPIIVLSGRTSERDKVELFAEGADDYLTKPFGVEELHARIQAAIRRSNTVAGDKDTSTIEFDGLRIDLAKHQVFFDEKEVHLTPTEYRLLRILLNNQGKAVSYHELMDEVSLGGKGDSAAYVRVYIMQLRKKLERQPQKPKHFLSVRGFGFRLETNATEAKRR